MKNDLFASALYTAAEQTPQKAAFTDASDGTVLTYLALRDTALRTAAALLRIPNPHKAPVAVLVSRRPDAVSAMFGVLFAGGWYVSVDAELPPERIRMLLDVCSPCAVLDAAGYYDGKDVPADPGRPVLRLPDYAAGEVPEVSAMPSRSPEAPLFGIFTSGSTGMPKLVVKSLAAMQSFIEVYCSVFGFGADEVFGNQIPFYFDASTKDIYATVALGASCVILPQKEFSFPVNLVRTLNDYRVSTVVWVPSALGIAAKFRVFSAAVPEYLRNVLFVGERMPVKYLNEWMDHLPGTRFVNLYGSTEVAGNSCYYIVDRRFEGADILPVGRPFPGTRVFLLDPETGKEAPEGEICVAGPGLADGYYGDEEKTAGVFREVSLPDFDGRLYFSGDYGRTNTRGEFICVSRRDSQIKHMGHRIELGEIESAAAAADFVTEACCLYDAENEKIVLFFSADTDRSRELRTLLSASLPKYMIPHKFRFLPALPHNRNGKLDRAAMKGSL